MVGPQFYFLRHGQTDWNLKGRLQGKKDVPLNVEGERQARALITAVRSLELGQVFCSPLQRARKTCDIVCGPQCAHIGYADVLAELGAETQLAFTRQGSDDHQLKASAQALSKFLIDVVLRAVNSRPVLLISHGSVFDLICQVLKLQSKPIENAALIRVYADKCFSSPYRLDAQHWCVEPIHDGFSVPYINNSDIFDADSENKSA